MEFHRDAEIACKHVVRGNVVQGFSPATSAIPAALKDHTTSELGSKINM